MPNDHTPDTPLHPGIAKILGRILDIEPRRILRLNSNQFQVADYLKEESMISYEYDLEKFKESSKKYSSSKISYVYNSQKKSQSSIDESIESAEVCPHHSRSHALELQEQGVTSNVPFVIEDITIAQDEPLILFPIKPLERNDFENLKLLRLPKDDFPGNQVNEERGASWMELIFDVFFVAVLRILAETPHYTVNELLILIFKFWVIWWAWLSSILYDTKHDTDDLYHRVGKIIQILGVAGFALSIEEALSNTFFANLFAISNILIRIVLLSNYTIVTISSVTEKNFRSPANISSGKSSGISRYLKQLMKLIVNLKRPKKHLPTTASLLISIILFGASCAFDDGNSISSARIITWSVAMAFETVAKYYSMTLGYQVPFSGSHLPERMGLFTIIIIGEGIIASLTASSHSIQYYLAPPNVDFRLSYEAIGFQALCILIYMCLWGLYFDDFGSTISFEERIFDNLKENEVPHMQDSSKVIVSKKEHVVYDQFRTLWIALHFGVHLLHGLYGIYVQDAIAEFRDDQTELNNSADLLNSNIKVLEASKMTSLPDELTNDQVAKQLIITFGCLFLFNSFIKFLSFYNNPNSVHDKYSLLSRLAFSGITFSLYSITFPEYRYFTSIVWLMFGICSLFSLQNIIDIVIRYQIASKIVKESLNNDIQLQNQEGLALVEMQSFPSKEDPTKNISLKPEDLLGFQSN